MILKNRHPRLKVPLPTLKGVLSLILKELGIPKADLDLTFVSDPAIRRLNRRFRGMDRPTDVLSFPLWEKNEAFCNGRFLGDIVISSPTAARQAKGQGKAFFEEIVFLTIHGTLHLLGYDHEVSASEAQKMERMEKKLMKVIRKKFFEKSDS